MKKIRLTYEQQKKINGIIFLLPFLIGFLLFFLIPIITTIVFSLNIVGVADEGGRSLTWNGFKNYYDLFFVELASDNQTQIYRMFYEEFRNIIINTPLIVIFSLFAAILLNRKFKGQGIVRVIFFLPIVLGLNIVVNLMTMSQGSSYIDARTSGVTVFSSDMLQNVFLNAGLGQGMVTFLASSVSRIFTIMAQSGVQILIYLAGLQSINPSLYEVADIEGANQYETFWKITLPLIAPLMVFVAIYTVVDMFLASSLTNEIYTFTFIKNKIGIGAALSVCYLVFVLLIVGVIWLLAQWKVMKR
ncbi:MAG: sugar ABC transporter permease [Bacilli bacterium]|nr:sugar ABC transporter permease [Bacilli bacterium]